MCFSRFLLQFVVQFWKKWLRVCVRALITVVDNVCRTRWIARLDAFDNFYDLLPAILTAIETTAKNVDGKYSRSNVEKVAIYCHLSVSNYCNSCDCPKDLIIYKRSYKEAARYRQRSSQSNGLYKAVKRNVKRITRKYRYASCNMVPTLAKEVDVKENIKRKCRTQWYRDNYDEGFWEECYKKSVLIPFLNHLITTWY